MPNDFLPVTKADLKQRNWPEVDIVLITGDAYVDHPAYGAALIGRYLEAHGFKVGIIPQPDWRHPRDFMRLGRPRLFFGITAGNADSMVVNYTANKRPRRRDAYSPADQPGRRPDRAVIVYANMVRQAFKGVTIVLGGLEASLRRLSHYDYWDNGVRRSILLDARADILVYGMGERQIVEIARALEAGRPPEALLNIRGTVVIRDDLAGIEHPVIIPSFEEVAQDKRKFNRAFTLAYAQMSPRTAGTVIQPHGRRFVVQYPPALPLAAAQLDKIYALPYARRWHPGYDAQGGVSGLTTVKFSLTAHRGCCGECAFCALYFHQGRIVQSRSVASIIREARLLAQSRDFRGTLTDVGGPTANLYAAHCPLWAQAGFCARRKCLWPGKCPRLKLGYAQSIRLLRQLRDTPKVKHVFIGSGLRYDLLVDEPAQMYLREICAHHISGMLKVAPEHCADEVLQIMRKPPFRVYEQFVRRFQQTISRLNKELYLVNYFLSAHPGATLREALQLAVYLARKRLHPQQVQDFIPAPMTLSASIYWTGEDPFTGRKIYTARTFQERKMQRALVQYYQPTNQQLVREALRRLRAENLAGELLNNYRPGKVPPADNCFE